MSIFVEEVFIMKKTLLYLFSCVAAFAGCKQNDIQLLPAEAFSTVVDGKNVELYTLRGGDITMQVTNFGARVVSIWTPDRDGVYADVSTGYECIDKYINNPGERFLGAAIGPVGNRIGKGTYTLDGETIQLPLNNDGNTLHGGFVGVDMMVWDVLEKTDSSLVFGLERPAGVDNWPGTLSVMMTYTLTKDSSFRIDYKAETDKAMPVNLTNHTFFNLTGDSSKSILNHEIQINASRTTPVDSLLIPTGEIVSLDGSPLDFRKAKAIGKDVNVEDVQLANGHGYDHNWCLDKTCEGVELAARLYEPESGRVLEVLTDQPGLQFYCGNFFDGTTTDKFGNPIGFRCSLALETQKWPDSINHDGFCDTVLRPGEEYTHTCIYRFSSADSMPFTN